MLCNCKPIVNLSQEGIKQSKNLEYLTYALTILAFIKLLLGDFNAFLNDIINVLMLLCTFMQASYTMAIWLMFFMIYNTFLMSTSLLLIIQNWYLGVLEILGGYISLYIFLVFVSCVLYIVIIHFSFLAYKEYKALYIEKIRYNGDDYRKIKF